MPKVTIYTTRFCPYCLAAKRLLTKKQIAFEEIVVDGRPDLRKTMTERLVTSIVPPAATWRGVPFGSAVSRSVTQRLPQVLSGSTHGRSSSLALNTTTNVSSVMRSP